MESSIDSAPGVRIVADDENAKSIAALVAGEGFRPVYARGRGPIAADKSDSSTRLIIVDIDSAKPDAELANRANTGVPVYSCPILCLLPLDFDPSWIPDLRAQDYLFKPIRPAEFATRLRGLLMKQSALRGLSNDRRQRADRRQCARRQVDLAEARLDVPASITINKRSNTALVDGVETPLTPKEFRLLSLLLDNIDQTVPTDAILDAVWRNSKRASLADVHQYIHMLRHKIEADPKQPQRLQSVRGFGYRLVNVPPA